MPYYCRSIADASLLYHKQNTVWMAKIRIGNNITLGLFYLASFANIWLALVILLRVCDNNLKLYLRFQFWPSSLYLDIYYFPIYSVFLLYLQVFPKQIMGFTNNIYKFSP